MTNDEDDVSENDMQGAMNVMSEKGMESVLFNSEEKSFALDNDQVQKDFDTIEVVENVKEGNALKLQDIGSVEVKVIPLYVPDDAIVKVFMVHGSEKSALVLATFALGFQQQVIYAYFYQTRQKQV